MALAGDLAKHIADLEYDDLPDAAVHWAKVAILDTVGVGVAGANQECVTILEKAMAADAGGPCQLFGKYSFRAGSLVWTRYSERTDEIFSGDC